jgi:hypothetical protein
MAEQRPPRGALLRVQAGSGDDRVEPCHPALQAKPHPRVAVPVMSDPVTPAPAR